MDPITDKSRLTRLGHVVDTEDALIPARRDGQFWHRDGDVVVVVAGLHFKITHDFLFATDENGEPLPDVMNPFTRNRLPALFGARGTPQDPVPMFFVEVHEMRDFLRFAYARTKDIAKFRGFTIMQLVNATSLALQLQRRDFIDYALEALPDLLSADSSHRLRHCTAAEYRALLRLNRRLPMPDLKPNYPFEEDVSQTYAWRFDMQAPFDIGTALDFGEELGLRTMLGHVYYEVRKRMDAEDDKKEEDDDDDDEDEDDEDVFSSPKRENSCVARLAPIHRQRLFVGALSLHSFWLRTMLRAPALPCADRDVWRAAWHSACVQVCSEKGSADVLAKLEHLRVVLEDKVCPTIWSPAEAAVAAIIKAFRLSLPSHFLGPANEEEEEAVFCDSSDEEDAWEEGSTEGDEDEDGEDTIRVSFQATSIPSKNEHGDDQDALSEDDDEDFFEDEDVCMSSGRVDSDVIMHDVHTEGVDDHEMPFWGPVFS
ncbi:unnamed protein product [Mycena citricolor]|uniref:Uncharacterized protein n=1 Tax=Mycena citricolor TaxID=2018698 RepID=A0AAD2K3G1_9AGAR|nr:unnamed protein product [Mycena citricolor]